MLSQPHTISFSALQQFMMENQNSDWDFPSKPLPQKKKNLPPSDYFFLAPDVSAFKFVMRGTSVILSPGEEIKGKLEINATSSKF